MVAVRFRSLPVTALLLATAVVSLSAHLRVEKTLPATDAVIATAPKELRVWFSQNPSMPVSALALEGPSGKVELGKVEAGKTDDKADRSIVATISGTLTAGDYVASWKTAGSDGHIQTGTFKFTLQAER